MSDIPQRFDHIRRSARIGRYLAIVGLCLFASVAVFLVTAQWGADTWFHRNLVALGIVAGVLFLIGVFVLLWNLTTLLLKIEGNSFRSYGVLRDLHAEAERQSLSLSTISENTQLSDLVRAVTHRARERTALRLAINEEIIRGDWEAAYALVELLESRHGYRNEAMRLRKEVDESRGRDTVDRVHDAAAHARSLMDAQSWDQARRVMDRLIAAHHDHPDVRDLPEQFRRLRNEHKRRLLKEWDESVQRNEVDRGIEILKQLDQYLTSSEAAALQESARGVFRAKLHNLGVQFSLAVAEQNWRDALRVGRQIAEEFPNSRMASEVRDRLHVLSRRAEETAGVAVAGNAAS